MVSDSELVDRLREFLRTSDLNTTTTAIVRRKLEEDFGVDLTEKKAFIREQVDLFLQSQHDEKTTDGNGDEEPEMDDDDDDEDEEEEEEEEEENPTVKSEAKKNGSDDEESEEEEESSNGRKKKGSSKLKKDVKKRGGGGFTKVCSLSPQLQDFVGVPELARTEVVRQLWAYIREKDLQDPKNRRNILCDETLRNLFRVDTINMFQMNKALSKHIWPLDSEEAPVKTVQKEKQRKQEKSEDSDEPKPKKRRREDSDKKPRKKREGAASGFLAPLPLSEALVSFFGTGETTLSRAGVVKKMWEYIKENNLQDPSDKRRVICDDKLKELFDVDSFNGFTVPKLLAVHFIKPEQIMLKMCISCIINTTFNIPTAIAGFGYFFSAIWHSLVIPRIFAALVNAWPLMIMVYRERSYGE